jgi:hypothetical protein
MVAVVLLLMVASCGGGGAGDPQDTVATTTAADGTSGPGTTSAQSPATTAANGGSAATGLVTIGEMTWQFGLGDQAFTQCEYDQFGTGNLFAAMVLVDDAGAPVMTDGGAAANVLFELYPDNYEELGLDPPGIELDDKANEQLWIADIIDEVDFDIQPGISQVTSLKIDGPIASGTATFYDRNVYFAWLGGTGEEPAGVEGTFQVDCAGE